MGQATGQPGNGGNNATDDARQTALDPTLPGWAAEVVGLLLDGDLPTLDTLERVLTAAPWLFAKGRDWLTR
jgi:hypothetical protein